MDKGVTGLGQTAIRLLVIGMLLPSLTFIAYYILRFNGDYMADVQNKAAYQAQEALSDYNNVIVFGSELVELVSVKIQDDISFLIYSGSSGTNPMLWGPALTSYSNTQVSSATNISTIQTELVGGTEVYFYKLNQMTTLGWCVDTNQLTNLSSAQSIKLNSRYKLNLIVSSDNHTIGILARQVN